MFFKQICWTQSELFIDVCVTNLVVAGQWCDEVTHTSMYGTLETVTLEWRQFFESNYLV